MWARWGGRVVLALPVAIVLKRGASCSLEHPPSPHNIPFSYITIGTVEYLSVNVYLVRIVLPLLFFISNPLGRTVYFQGELRVCTSTWRKTGVFGVQQHLSSGCMHGGGAVLRKKANQGRERKQRENNSRRRGGCTKWLK